VPPVRKPYANSVKIAVVTDEVEMLTIVERRPPMTRSRTGW
jgi:hypothetical protein